MKIVDDQRRPAPRLRGRPVSLRPSRAVAPIGREDEQTLAARAGPGAPVQFCGPDGIGKSALLKHHARVTAGPDDGVVFLSARRRSLDDLGPQLFDAFWESDERYVPSPAQLGRYLHDRAALIVLDDVDLDRDDLDVLIDLAPGCGWVMAARERTLWSGGHAAPLAGLSPSAGAALIERELGRDLAPAERTAAEQVAVALDGHPQRLVEAAAIVGAGHASLEQLAHAPDKITAPPYALTDSQLRLLAVLAAADGAALATDHVASVAGDRDAPAALADLERKGWVKSQSPRYRLVRPLPEGAPEPPVDAVLEQLTRQVSAGRPVADDAEAIEGALRSGVARRDLDAAVDLARAAERPLATAGLLGSWERVLWLGESAARGAGRPGDAAWFVHQLGSRAMCVGSADQAEQLLRHALGERERIGDHDGAELTRHNLEQLLGGGGPPPGPNGHHPWRPRTGPTLAALAAVLVVGFGILQLTGDDGSAPAGSETPAGGTTQQQAPAQQGTGQQTPAPSGGSGSPGGGTPGKPTTAAPPVILIATPADGATYATGETVIADYKCTTKAKDRRIVECRGPAAVGEPIDTSEGPHPFIVTARDDAGTPATATVTYVAERRPRGTGPAKPPPATDPNQPPPAVEPQSCPTGTVLVNGDCVDIIG